MNSTSRLQAQHIALRTTMRHLLDVAVAARGYRAAAPGLLRDLDAAIVAHVDGEASHDYAAITAEAETLDRLGADWRAYAEHWSTTRIAADWPGFAAATHAIVPRMIARIEQEDRCLARSAAAKA